MGEYNICNGEVQCFLWESKELVFGGFLFCFVFFGGWGVSSSFSSSFFLKRRAYRVCYGKVQCLQWESTVFAMGKYSVCNGKVECLLWSSVCDGKVCAKQCSVYLLSACRAPDLKTSLTRRYTIITSHTASSTAPPENIPDIFEFTPSIC